jgi:seryl-tRNA synthetase
VGLRIKAGADPAGTDVKELREQGNRLKQQVAVLEEEEKALTLRLREQLLSLPNLPSAETPDGKSEADNVEIKRSGIPRQEAGLEEHWQIGERLGLFRDRALRAHRPEPFHHPAGPGGRLERALISFMLDRHAARGYTEVMPPILVNSASLLGSGQLPEVRRGKLPLRRGRPSGSPPPPRCPSPPCTAMRCCQPTSCRSNTPPTRPVSAAKPAPTAATPVV